MNLNEFGNTRETSLYLHKRSSGKVYTLMGKESNVVEKIMIDQDLETPLVESKIVIRLSPESEALVQVGDVLSYYDTELNLDYERVYRRKHVFYVMKISNDENSFKQTITCRNLGHWIIRNSYHLKIEQDETTSQFIERTAINKGIPIHKIEPTTYKHDAKIFQKTSLHEAWRAAISTNILSEQILYNLSFSDVGLVFEKIVETSKMWTFEVSNEFANILNPVKTVSIIDPTFTNIAISIRTEDAGSTLVESYIVPEQKEERRNEKSIELYGEFVTEIDVTNYGKPDEIGDRLQEIVNNGSPVERINFRTYAINSIKPTDRVMVFYPSLESIGVYFIDAMQTSIADRNYWHDLQLIKLRDIQSDLINQLGLSTSPAGRSPFDL